ncbi:RsmE family RNA methyltransferase [Furfurilactobacillus sp. WILCCON 0119]|uniref:RsmE family RNA methyltransferase n=1 Tax=Furfurilactobacillus entadae TaxID=2922307 RepID=UPI0035EEAEA4
MQHYFLPTELVLTTVGETFSLTPALYKHFVQVLRAQVGTTAEFVTGEHQLLEAQLTTLTPDDKQAVMTVTAFKPSTVELPVHTRIVCGVPKGDKAELITQKATELGVAEIVFVPTAWAVASWKQKAAKKISRYQEIATNAAQQSHRLVIPTVRYCESLTAALTLPTDAGLVAWEEAAKQGEQAQLAQTLTQLQPGQWVTAIFGPEGGLSQDEAAQITAAGYVTAGLGPRILRTETAPLYFLSAVSYATELFA